MEFEAMFFKVIGPAGVADLDRATPKKLSDKIDAFFGFGPVTPNNRPEDFVFLMLCCKEEIWN